MYSAAVTVSEKGSKLARHLVRWMRLRQTDIGAKVIRCAEFFGQSRMRRPCQKGVEPRKAGDARLLCLFHPATPLTDHAVAATAQTFHNDRFAAFVDIHRTGRPTGERADDGATQRIAIVIDFTEYGPGTRTQNGSPECFLVKLLLVAGQRLTCREVGLVGRHCRSIQNGLIVRPTVRAGGNQ